MSRSAVREDKDGSTDPPRRPRDSAPTRGQQALPAVETSDWDMPAAYAEIAHTRASDAYKLGLLILRLFARSHDARALPPYLRYVPVELRDLLYRALEPDTANRPPAGEWQRALGQLIIAGGLNERCPGPPQQRTAGRTAPSARPMADQAWLRPAVRARRPMPVSSPGRVHSTDWLRRAVIVMWILAGTLVLFVILSHLFASALRTQERASAIPTQSGSPYGYYAPSRSAPTSPQLP